MLDNTRQCRDKTSAAADKKSLVFSFPFPPLIALLAWRRRTLRAISFSWERNEDCSEEKNSSAGFDIWFLVQSIFCIRPSEYLIFP